MTLLVGRVLERDMIARIQAPNGKPGTGHATNGVLGQKSIVNLL